MLLFCHFIRILIQNIEKTSVGANIRASSAVRPRATKGRPYEIWDISRIYLRIRITIGMEHGPISNRPDSLRPRCRSSTKSKNESPKEIFRRTDTTWGRRGTRLLCKREKMEKSTKTGGFCSPGVVMVWYTVRARFKGPAPLHGRAFRESHRWAGNFSEKEKRK